MKVKKLVVYFMAGFLFSPVYCRAADEDTSSKVEIPPFKMEEVIVTASRYREGLSMIPANVTVIGQKDIINSTAQDIPGLLQNLTGLHVTDVAGNHRNYKVDLRGFGETAQLNTLVLVDGRRITEADLSGTDWTLIPLDRVERIEIIRGGRGSVIYGDNASGGVINIITKEGAKNFQAGGRISGGSYGTYQSDAYIGGTKKDLSYFLSGNWERTSGYRDNSDSDRKDFGLNLGYFLGDHIALNLSGAYHQDETGLPGALRLSELASGINRTKTVHPDDFADVDDRYIKFMPEIFFLENSFFQCDFSYKKRDSSSFSSFTGGTFNGDTAISTNQISPQFVIRESLFGFNNNLTLGFDFIEAKEDILNTVAGLFPSTARFNLEKENTGYYFHEEFYPIDNLALSAGYRHDQVNYSFFPSTPGSTEFDKDLVTAGVNYAFDHERRTFLYFNYSKGFRYPVLDELFDFFTNTIDTTLIPQTSQDYELGIRRNFTKDLFLSINLFRIYTEKELFFNPTKGLFGANDNLDGKARRDGIEIAISKRFDRWDLRGTYSYINGKIDEGQFAGGKIPGVAEHKASFVARYFFGHGFMLALNGIYIGQRPFESDFANAFPEQDAYGVLNTRLQYHRKNLTAFLDINNITNAEYSGYGVLSSPPVEPAFYPSQRLNFLIGVRLDYL